MTKKVPEIKPLLRDNVTIEDAVTLCCEGEKFYHGVTESVASFSMRKLFEEMAEDYVSIQRQVHCSASQIGSIRPKAASTKSAVNTYYSGMLVQLNNLSDSDKVQVVLRYEQNQLQWLKKAVKSTDVINLKRILSDVAAHLQNLIDQLRTMQANRKMC